MSIKSLILKIGLLASLLLVAYYGSVYKLTRGTVDNYYSKFTHKSGSIIIGLSRTTFGIVPSTIEVEFGNKINNPVLNFALDGAEARYGQMLLRSIKHKIDTTSTKGLFILSVLPGSFLIPKEVVDDENLKLDKDKKGLLSKMTKFNHHPNYEYIRKYYDEALYKGFVEKKKVIKQAHPDGWVEFKTGFGNYKVSDKQVENWKNRTFEGYKIIFNSTKKSNYRISKFEDIIQFLKKYGTVVLVRLPVNKEFIELEKEFWPDFDNFINSISTKYNIQYHNYSNSDKKYDTFDGSHLFGYSAKEFTKDLCDDIKSYQKNQLKED